MKILKRLFSPNILLLNLLIIGFTIFLLSLIMGVVNAVSIYQI